MARPPRRPHRRRPRAATPSSSISARPPSASASSSTPGRAATCASRRRSRRWSATTTGASRPARSCAGSTSSTGEAIALPSLGLWAAVGSAGSRVLDVTTPPPNPTVARADTLRVGFALDADRHLTFVLAADEVRLGTHDLPGARPDEPDAVMDAVGNASKTSPRNCSATSAMPSRPPESDRPRPAAGSSDRADDLLADLLSDPLAADRRLLADADDDDATPRGRPRSCATPSPTQARSSAASSHGTRHRRRSVARPARRSDRAAGLDHRTVVTTAIAASTSVDTLGSGARSSRPNTAATLAETRLAARTASSSSPAPGAASRHGSAALTPPRASPPSEISEGCRSRRARSVSPRLERRRRPVVGDRGARP